MAVTIYDLSKEAGVSIATVSKALSASYAESEETKQRVREIAAQLGFRPNARARSFARQKNGTVLFVTDMYRNISFENPHMFEIITGITKSLEQKDYALQLKHMTAQEAPDGIREMMLQAQADGVILHAAILTRQLANVLSKATWPYLVIGKPNFPCGVCWMDVNHELSGQLAGNYLLDKGYRRIAFLMGKKDEDKISAGRLSGLHMALDEEELDIEARYGDGSFEAGIRQAEELLARQERPEVILCTNNYLAMGCLQYIRHMGLAIPDDVALMTFDNYPIATIVEPTITSVAVDVYELGWEAARFMLQKIKRPNLQTQSYCTVPELQVREST